MTTATASSTRLVTRTLPTATATATATAAFGHTLFLRSATANQSIPRTGTGLRTRTTDGKTKKRGEATIPRVSPFPVDPWAPSVDSQSIASQLFAFSLFPYLGFLYFITRSRTSPPLTLFGFYFLLAFVGATIPAGIYAKVQYGTSLSNVDWLHGGAESLLTLTNLFIVLGLRRALRRAKDKEETSDNASRSKKESSV
ncbi:hypothetical protein MLD38_020736 [Melastoma candidum]|uniref:Uncharacterized protein n=1 Tax=Melastoma candidum TaxID=119954 RepID=A0ACB9QDT5_9MYRT|nr:hypothetical protein MLD38_020736 [Melastoma candidum]